jgi:hypothetical protein
MDFTRDVDRECAPHVESSVCSRKDVVHKLRGFIKKKFSKTLDDKETIEFLKEKSGCGTEACVLKSPLVEKILPRHLIHKTIADRFKPTGPRLTKEWLSNIDIDSVLRSYAKKYKDFYHIPFQMRDFQDTGGELSLLDFCDNYKEGYRTFGTVVNTDLSTGRGIHWFAIFGDFREDNTCFTIEYFNSSGQLPVKEISAWMKYTKHIWNKSFNKPVKDVITSRIQHQNDNHSCGPYSLYYIISRLEGVPYLHFRNNKIKDELMLEFRKYLFLKEG